MQDHYRTLGLLSIAEDVVIKAAYKALAQKYHPDKYKGDSRHAQKVMAELNAAYGALRTKALRQAHDAKMSAFAGINPPKILHPPEKKSTRGWFKKSRKICLMKLESLRYLKNFLIAKFRFNRVGLIPTALS
jgi:curved DNA-binding protein CbpA